DSAMSARSSASSSSCCTFLNLDICWNHLKSTVTHLLVTDPGLQFLELLIQTVLQVLDCDLQVLLHPLQVRTGVSLHLLLHPQSVIPTSDLSIQRTLHGVNNPLAVPLSLFHFLILLCQLPVHLTPDLVQLQLYTQNL
uniref:Uncharacterized protein n=2 Tax=Esox lucius TaxID=8010 RepID=A0AAY5K8K7_ESOLU